MKINSSVAANSYLLDAVTNNIGHGTSVRTFSLHSVRSIIMRLMMVMMIVGGWNVVRGEDVELTFSFTSNPGGWPTTDSDGGNYTYTINPTSYTFALGANIYYNNSNNGHYLMLKYTTSLGLPAIPGYKLTKVVAKNTSACSVSTQVGISSSPSSASYISGGTNKTWSTQNSSYTYNLSGTASNTMYYLYVTNKNAQITQLVLTYTSVAVAYTVNAESNNTSLGTVSVSGSVITASPIGCVGYASPAYNVTSGAATVSQSDNTFNVTPTSNCTVRINFAVKPTYNVNWIVGGSTFSTHTYCQGSTIPAEDVPTPTSGDCNGKTFIGWSTAEVAETDVEPTLETPAGAAVNRAMNFYAVFAEASGGGSAEWRLVTDASSLTAGDIIVIASNAHNLVAGDISSKVMGVVTSTFSGDKSTITSLGVGAIQLTLGGTSGSWTLSNNGRNLGATDVKDLAWDSGTTTWSISISGNGATIQNNTASYGRFLHNVNTPRFTTYTSSTTSAMLLPQIYRLSGGISYSAYSTSCVAPTTATITYNANGGSGSMASQTVDIGDDVIISANGYTAPTEKYFVEWNTAANGSGASYLPEETITLSSSMTLYAIWATNTYNVVWYVNSSPIRNRTYDYGTSISDGDVPPDPTSDDCDGKTFVGWSIVEVDETNTRPSMLSRSDIEGTIVTGSLQYYAVFANADGADVSCTLVTSVSSLSIGDNVVIAAKDYDVAISTTQNNNNRFEASIEKGVGTLNTPLGNDVCVFELRAGTTSGTWAFYDENNNGYIYAASSSSNHLKTQNTLDANGSWTISISNGIATITAQGSNTRNLLRYNNSSSLFSCYGSGQKDVSIYKYSGGIVYSNYSTSCTPCEADATISSTPLTASFITTNSATIECVGITNLGGAHCHIRSYGFVYSLSANPTLENGTSEIVGSVYTITGTAFSKNIEGLNPCTTYHVRAYATNGHGTAYGPDFTFATANNAAITSLTTDCMKNTEATINMTYSSCTATSDIFVIAIRKGANVPVSLGTTTPASITANTIMGSGYQFGESPNNSYVVYKSNGSTMPTSLTITGLEAGTSYKLKAYRWQSAEGRWTTDGTIMTLNMPSVTNLQADNNETSEMLTWNISETVCAGGHYVVICKEGDSDITSTCANFTSITANAAFGSGTQTQTGEYAVYSGSATTASITNITSGTTYTAAVFYVDADGNCSLPTQTTFTYSETTILEPGDLAIVAVNNKRLSTYQNTADEFSFVVFKTVTPGTRIDMTDNGYERNYEGYWGTEEGFWSITRTNSNLVAGSVVTISETVGRIGYNIEPVLGSNINIYVNGADDHSNWTIEANGPLDLNKEDQIWMMQGGEWNVIEDNKAEYTGNVLYGFTATGWKPNVGFDATRGSRIYPSCGCFITTIEVGDGIVKYTGPLDHATKGEWITRINNEDNWSDYTTSSYPNAARNYCNASRPDATNYPSVNYPLTIDPGDFTKGKWSGKESDDWCDCRNWVSLVVPDENYDVEIPDVGNRNRVSLHEGVTAKCKTLTVKNGGFFNNTQANSVLKVVEDITIDAGGSFRPSENNAFEIIVGGNILNSGVFITNENTSLTLNGESSQSISAPSSGGNFKLRNLTIASPSNGFDADTIELYGNLRDNSASNLGFNLPQALTFRGSRSQTSTRTTITDITINKSSNDLTLSGMLNVNGKAKFVNGNIVGNVTFSASATSAGASTDSYVDGTVTKKANASAFSFPTGSNGVLGTLEVNSLDADADLKFNHEPDGFDASEMPVWWNQNNMCGPNEGNAKFDHVTNMYFWNLGTSATIADAVFSVLADDDVHFNSETIEHDNADIDMAIYDGCWKNLGGTAATSDPYHLISVSDVDLPATRAGGDKVVTFGSIDHNTLLPIELTAFSAECNGSYAKISWTTATERNNDYFVLERSDDAISFDEIARLAGAGSSINPIDYTYIDNNVHGGDIYYRLVQVDYDGTRSVSEIIAVNCTIDADGDPEVVVYPNPFANDLTLRFENFGDRVALVEVYDMLGRMLVSRKVVCSQNDYEFVLPLGGLPDGAYNVRVSAEDFVINRQVVKNR